MNELKLQTPVDPGRSNVEISFRDRIVMLGSCFADNIGGRMKDLGFDACVNPFGTLYNPESIARSIRRLNDGIPFSSDECVRMGAGADLVCSFSHHTSFARKTAEEFLDNANAALEYSSAAWKRASKVVITLGTAWCFEHIASGAIVSNCLKIDAKQFERKRLSFAETASILRGIVASAPEKEFIMTVSPIRHMKDGAHGNQLSKSTLLLAIEDVAEAFPERVAYFPAYEIVMDELRDYRFYCEDMVHPSPQATELVWSRFMDFALPSGERAELEAREKALRSSRHRPLH